MGAIGRPGTTRPGHARVRSPSETASWISRTMAMTEPGRTPESDPTGDRGSNAGLYLVLAMVGSGLVLMVLKLLGLWE
ncbi:hypothetical protein ElP_72950 (plasmid) [Tautonia plasticadhaerens]|uniref:Uncharacterized protein n=1 Tax=Tautonia plasticadhaerens TaxID=2527974 RepID=A0A518HEQ5_9BACT|nr:hypothetical protein ElP_72950 [Tautonia plasticadhaerens]